MKKTFTIICLTFFCLGSAESQTGTNVVISQVYGGGGNTNAPYNADFIELFNPTGSAVDISTWSIQFVSAAGTTWAKMNLTGSIAPGKYYLIQTAAAGATGAALPPADLVVSPAFAMGATSGKVILSNQQTALTTACPSATAIDYVGYGATATCFETAPTAAPGNTTVILRQNNGCTDANNNATDFAVAAPNPRNSATAANVCATVVIQNYYNTKANLGLTVTGTWSTTLDGSGPSPANFTDAYQYFNIVNQANVGYTGVWNVTGTDSKVIVGDGVNPITFEINAASDSVTSATKIDVLNNGLLTIGNNRIPALNILATGSTVNFSQVGTSTSDTIKIPAISYYNLYLTGGLKYFGANTTTVRGDLVADATIGLNGPAFNPFATVNAFGNVDLTNGAAFDPAGDAGRITLKMNGPGPVQQLNAGSEIKLFRLQRDSAATNNILLGLNTTLTLGNAASGGLQLTPASATLSLGANTLNIINAGTVSTSATGRIASAGGAINILKSIGTGDAGTLRFTTGATLTAFTLNLGPAVTKDSITITDNLSASLVNLVRGKIVMTAGDTLSALVMNAPTVVPYSFVDGAVRLTGTANLGFAVGKGNNFAPVGISDFGGTPQSYTVHYFNTGYGNYTVDPTTLAAFPNYEVSKSLYWNINSTNTAPYNAVFGYTDVAANIISPSQIRIANFDNIDWADRGGLVNPANTPAGGTVAVPFINVYGSFTFGATAAGIVPVRLTYFAAQKAGGMTIMSWATEQEINSKFFTVERSTDGGAFWQPIATLPASGNSSIPRTYTTVDNNPSAGVNLYRLRATDADGRFTNSAIEAVLFSQKNVVLVTPNPASNFINIYLSEAGNFAKIVLADANGKTIHSVTTPEQSYRINVSGYASGIYFLKVINNGNTIVQKVMIQ